MGVCCVSRSNSPPAQPASASTPRAGAAIPLCVGDPPGVWEAGAKADPGQDVRNSVPGNFSEKVKGIDGYRLCEVSH